MPLTDVAIRLSGQKKALECIAQTSSHKPYDVAIIQRMIAECEQKHAKSAQPEDISKSRKLLHQLRAKDGRRIY